VWGGVGWGIGKGEGGRGKGDRCVGGVVDKGEKGEGCGCGSGRTK